MVWKNIFIVFALSLVVFSSRNALAQTENTEAGILEPEINSVENIGNTIKEKTPNFIARPIIYVTERVDGFREKIRIIIEARKVKTMGELNASPAPAGEEGGTEDTTSKTEFFKAFKYLEVFVLILLLFIFSIKFLYYGFIALLILIILRFFWLRIY